MNRPVDWCDLESVFELSRIVGTDCNPRLVFFILGLRSEDFVILWSCWDYRILPRIWDLSLVIIMWHSNMCSVFYLQVYCIMISDYLQLERVKKIHVRCTCICRVCCHKWYCAKDIYCKLWSFIMTLEQIKPRLAFQSRKFRDWILGFWRLQSLIMGSSTPNEDFPVDWEWWNTGILDYFVMATQHSTVFVALGLFTCQPTIVAYKFV